MPRLSPLLAALLLAGCKATDAPRASDSTFIAAMSELRKLPAGADSATRAAVLRRRGFTPATLERRARELARDPARAAVVWEAIERPSVPEADSAIPARTRLEPATK